MNSVVKYSLYVATSVFVGVCSFTTFLSKLNFGNKNKVTVEDISEEEIEPDTEFDEE